MYKSIPGWNITIIKEGRLFEHKQTGEVVFVPRQSNIIIIIKKIQTAIKNLIKKFAYNVEGEKQ